MKNRYYLLIVTLLSIPFFGANTQKELEKLKTGSALERINAAEVLNAYYQSEARDSLRFVGEKLFFYGIQNHYYPAVEKGKIILSEFFILTGKVIDGITTLKSLIPTIVQRNDSKELCLVAKIISQGYVIERDAKSALYWAEKSVQHAQESNNKQLRSDGLLILSEAYLLSGKPEKALTTLLRYQVIACNEKNERKKSAVYAKLGDFYMKKGDLVRAEGYFLSSYECAKKTNLISPIANALNNLAIIYFENNDLSNSNIFFVKALQLRLKVNDQKAVSESYYNLGDFYYYSGAIEKAQFWYAKSLAIATKNNLISEQNDALNALAEISKTRNDFESANNYREQQLTLLRKIELDNRVDEEEIKALQLEMLQSEALAKSKVSINNGKSNLKWEWGVITLLVLLILLKFRFSSSDLGKLIEK